MARIYIRRVIAAFSLWFVLVFTLSSCEASVSPLRVCVDADATGNSPYSCETVMQSFLETIELMGGPADVVLEIVPKSGPERETAIDRIRTEIMSGKGPDVFIVPCGDGYLSEEPSIFPVPEKTLESGIFLTLDDYIENAQFMDWGKQTAVIMEAGRNEFGQQIIPLTYTMPITFFHAADIEGVKPGKETTWEDMLKDKTGILTVAATWDHVQEGETYFLASEDNYLEYVLGEFADYKEEKLLFTEEELLQRTFEILELEKAYDAGKYQHVPSHFQTLLYPAIFPKPNDMHWETPNPDSYRGIKVDRAQTMIPIYSDDGGITASITSFAAINANTRRPKDAFYIVDLMMRDGYQQHLDLYENWLAGHSSGILVNGDLLQEHFPSGGYWYYTNVNYRELVRVREQITHVRFRGGLAAEFDDMYEECKRADEAGEDIALIVSKYYDKLKQRIAE